MRAPRLRAARSFARVGVALAGASAAILGCNALLGIEPAVFEPDATAPAATDGEADAIATDASGDGASTDGATDAAPCDGVDLTSNPRHCGACNHDCLAGTCDKGICQPFLLASAAEGADAISIDATHAYWTNRKTGEIRRTPLAGGGTSELLFQASLNVLGDAFTVAGGFVWFADFGTSAVMKCAVTGCTATGATVAIGSVATPQAVASNDAGALYWSELVIGGNIGTCQLPCTDGGDNIVTGESRPWLLAPTGSDLYWTTLTPTTVRAKVGGAAATTLASPSFLGGITASGDRVFFVVPGVGPRVMLRDGGSNELLTPGVANANPILADATHVYFAEVASKGRVLRCPVGGCGTGPQALAFDQNHPAALALDAQSVVWANRGGAPGVVGGSIMRVAK